MMTTGAVLLVDDELSVRKSAAAVLTRLNLSVDTAPDGATAIKLARQQEYDVAVVDLTMPGLSGMDTVKRLKTISSDMEIIILTGQATLDTALDALHEHVFDFLCKPEGMRVLGRRVEQAIEHRRLIRHNRELVQNLEVERDRLWKELSAAQKTGSAPQESHSFLQTVIDAIPELTIVIDHDYRVVLANRSARELVGEDPVAQGMKCHQLTHRSDVPCNGASVPCPLKKVIAAKMPQVLEHKRYDDKGHGLLIEVRAAPVFDKAGEVIQIIESCRDITEHVRLQQEVSAAKRALEHQLSDSGLLVGESVAIRGVRRLIAEVAPTDMTVLIRGDSGTGKNVVARLLHELSGRKDIGAYVNVNCPAISEGLLESEMFGHEKGAFTGALKRKPGRFELAARGTILLDEIGLIPNSVQAKLLQVIDHKEFMRVGGSDTIHVDARILAATNSPLEEMVRDGRFRSDFFYRLNQFPIHLCPLRERREDIPLLVSHFLRSAGALPGRRPRIVSPEMLSRLVKYDWPGNVRELKTCIERFVLTGEPDVPGLAGKRFTGPAAAADSSSIGLEAFEVQAIMTALTETRWNQRKAAKLLGIGYGALRHRISKHNLKGSKST